MAERSRLHRQRKADKARHTAELIALLYAAVPPELAERLAADERYKDIITEALLR
ncbi:hypothetical protein [Azospirillum brasilense]|uniref:hypothetical protein n=1 Tax=Azospirillum brasilense TaxID=192 RepID=UPI0013B41D5B|nr:hypothetical protein [Azospirillum brasilense]